MPTHYTAIIEDKEDVTLKEYLLRCAMAFYSRDAKDDSAEAFVKVKPSEHYLDEMNAAAEAVKRLRNMNEDEIAQAARLDYEKQLEFYSAESKRREIIKQRYLRILKLTKAWNAPSELDSLKEFMIQQIKYCIDTDVSRLKPPALKDPQAWYEKELQYQESTFTYYSAQYKHEVAWTQKQNEWVDILLKAVESI